MTQLMNLDSDKYHTTYLIILSYEISLNFDKCYTTDYIILAYDLLNLSFNGM